MTLESRCATTMAMPPRVRDSHIFKESYMSLAIFTLIANPETLEAAPGGHVTEGETLAALRSVSFEDVCITSDIVLTGDPIPSEAFRLPEVDGVGVVFERAEGEKCQRCWKILPDVGAHGHPGVCKRCDEALG